MRWTSSATPSLTEHLVTVISISKVFRECVPIAFLGICLLVSVSACEKNEPPTPNQKSTQLEQHDQTPSRTQQPSELNKPTTPIQHVVLGYASPEEAYEMCEQARKERHWVTALDCLTEDAQGDAILQLHLALPQLLKMEKMADQFGTHRPGSKTDDSKKAALRALEKKYAGIIEEQNDTASVLPTKYEYFGDIMDFLARYGQGQEPTRQALTEVTIEGDTATGTAMNTYQNGKETSSNLKFKRLSGGWFKDGEVPD